MRYAPVVVHFDGADNEHGTIEQFNLISNRPDLMN